MNRDCFSTKLPTKEAELLLACPLGRLYLSCVENKIDENSNFGNMSYLSRL